MRARHLQEMADLLTSPEDEIDYEELSKLSVQPTAAAPAQEKKTSEPKPVVKKVSRAQKRRVRSACLELYLSYSARQSSILIVFFWESRTLRRMKRGRDARKSKQQRKKKNRSARRKQRLCESNYYR